MPQGYAIHSLAAYSIDSRAVTRDSGKSRFARVRKAFKALAAQPGRSLAASVNKGLRHSRSLLDRALLRPANLTRPIYFVITHKMQHFVSYTNYPHSCCTCCTYIDGSAGAIRGRGSSFLPRSFSFVRPVPLFP